MLPEPSTALGSLIVNNLTIDSTVQQRTGFQVSLETFETFNTIVASALGYILHLYIAIGIIKKKLFKDGYMALTYYRSYNDMVYLFTVFIIFEVRALDGSERYGHYFENFSVLIQSILLYVQDITRVLQLLLLFLCIVHRFLLFMRPGAINGAYIFFTVLAISISVFVIAQGQTPQRKKVLEISLMISTIAMIFFCIIVHRSLRRHFRASKYSLSVCEIQIKTSTFLTCLAILYSVCYFFMPFLAKAVSTVYLTAMGKNSHSHIPEYAQLLSVISFCMFPWLPFGNALLSLWSVQGTLSPAGYQPRRVTVVSTVSESQC